MIEFLGLAVAALALCIASIVSLKLKIPPLIVFLLIGMVVGTLGYLQDNASIAFIGGLGSVMLLFAIGTEFSIYKLFKTGFFREIQAALIELLLSFIILYVLFSSWFGSSTAMVIALAFSITSTGISLKLLQELGLTKKFDIHLIVKISVIEDLITVLVFAIISSLSVSSGSPINAVLISFFVSVLLFVIAYSVFSTFLDRFLFRFDIKEEDILMLALGTLLLFVSIASALGLSASFGAYIAGSVVSVWKEKWGALENDMRKFSYIFISFFFLSVGLQVSLANVNVPLLLLILAIVLVVKFAGLFVGTQFAFRSYRTAFFTSLGMLSRGELSLVIVSAAVTSNLVPQSFLTITALTVLLSVVISAILLRLSTDIYYVLRIKLPMHM